MIFFHVFDVRWIGVRQGPVFPAILSIFVLHLQTVLSVEKAAYLPSPQTRLACLKCRSGGPEAAVLRIAFLGLLAFSCFWRLSDWLGTTTYRWYVVGRQAVFGQALESETLPDLWYLCGRFAAGTGLLDEGFRVGHRLVFPFMVDPAPSHDCGVYTTGLHGLCTHEIFSSMINPCLGQS